MKRHIFTFLTVLLFLFCFLSRFQAEQKLPPEKHEVEVRLVLVDVIVTKDGEFVTDLTKDDFEIYEDDKNIPINSFDLISFGRRESMTLVEKQEGASPVVPRKQLVIIIDGINTWQRNLNKGLSKIVDELVSLAKLGNEAMIVQLRENKGSEILQPFTADEVLIKNALLLKAVAGCRGGRYFSSGCAG
jgi:VWFA-related protein